MKRQVIFVASIFFLVLLCVYFFLSNRKTFSNREEAFYLEDEYYGSQVMDEIELEELNALISARESFLVFVYQPMCSTSAELEQILSSFQEEYQIGFKKIAFSKVKNTKYVKFLKYYPSFIIYKDGEMVDFLESDKDSDLECYKSLEGFKEWLTKYVKLKDNDSLLTNENQNNQEGQNNQDNQDDANQQSNQEEDFIASVASLKDVSLKESKVNIYFFWGDGCPHCEEEFAFFDEIQDKMGDFYNLYTFETWYNPENAKLLDIFSEAMGNQVTGVPYTIIGNKSFKGFNSDSKTKFKSAIESQYKDSYDVYFDKIKG